MLSLVLTLWPLLLAAAVSREEPNACLLQQASSELQRAVLPLEQRQEPTDGDEGEESHGHHGGEGKAAHGHHGDKEPDLGSGKGDGDSEPESDHGLGGPDHPGLRTDKEESKHGHDDHPDKKKEESKHGHEDQNEREPEKKHHEKPGRGGHEKKNKPKEKQEDSPLASLRAELRLHIAISDLKGAEGGLQLFLKRLRTELAKAADIPIDRLDVLGIRGEYSDEGVSLFSKDIKASLQESPVLGDGKGSSRSIVDLEILPGTQPSELSPKGVYDSWKEQLRQKDSKLRKSPLKSLLLGATFGLNEGVEGYMPPEAHSEASRQAARLAAIALTLLYVL